jgi:transketolase
MRALPRMTVLSPADATQAKLMTEMAINELDGPVYIRFGREAVPDFTDEYQELQIGKGQLMKDGDDLSLVATGHMVWEALRAAEMLKDKGINARVINLHTIKPIDEEILLKAAKETGLIVTIEEHQVHGGMGSAVAEVVSQQHPVRMKILGMQDSFGESGKPEELMEKYGFTAKHIFDETMKVISGQKKY